MRVQDVIKADKANVDTSDWGTGKYPKSRFPLSKAGRRAYSLGSAWRWRFMEFDALDRRFVLRLIVSHQKAKAHIHLAQRLERDCVVLCSYEYHADRRTGWHLHTLCGERNDIDLAPAGTLVHGPWVKRLPAVDQRHRRSGFSKDIPGGLEAWLWQEMMRFFGIDVTGDML